MLKVKSTTLRRFGGFTIKFDYIHSSIPPPNFDTSTICRLSAETLIHKSLLKCIVRCDLKLSFCISNFLATKELSNMM